MGYWLKQINEALKYRGYTISGVITGAPPVLAYFFGYIPKGASQMEWIPSFAISGVAGAIAVAFFISLKLVETQKKLDPKLEISGTYISHAQFGPIPNSIPADFIQIVVKNISGLQINNCQAYITSITKHIFESDHTGGYLNVPPGAIEVRALMERIPMVRSLELDRSITVYPGRPEHFNLVFTLSSDNSLNFSREVQIPYTLINAGFLNDKGAYDFRIIVTGDNIPTVIKTVRLGWNKIWYEIALKVLEDE